jgi:hypothetical protein
VTSAFSDFEERARQVEELLDVLVPGWDPERASCESFRSESPERVGVSCRSALVLLVSYFEGFLKDLIDVGYDTIAESGVSGSQLPSRVRGHIISKHVNALRRETDAAKIWEASSAIAFLGGALRSDEVIDASLLPREQTRREVTSIDPGRINRILQAFGEDDLNRGPMSRYGERMRALKSLRDNAVHGNEGDLPSLGSQDIREARDLLRDCARELDDRVDGLLGSLCTGADAL